MALRGEINAFRKRTLGQEKKTAFSKLQIFPVLQKAQGSIFTMIFFTEESLCDIGDLHQIAEDSGQE